MMGNFSILNTYIFFHIPDLIKVCGYEKMGGTTKDKGKFINETHADTPEDCGAKCDSMDGCGSTVYCNFGGTIGKNCYLHGKKLVGSEELKLEVNGRCFSYYKKCTLGSYIKTVLSM